MLRWSLQWLKDGLQLRRSPSLILLRLILANNPSAFKSVSSKDAVLATLLKAIDANAPWDTPLPKPRDTNILLVLRTVANMFQAPSGPVPAPWTSTLFTTLHGIPSTVWTKAHLLAMATLLFNYSCVIHRSKNAAQDQEAHLELIAMVLENANSDPESLYRALVAFGNVASSVAKPKLGKTTVRWLKLSTATAKRTGEKRIQDLVQEVQRLIV